MITYDFAGKTVIVTGSARGIGRRIAERFFKAGANVALCSRSGGSDEILNQIAGADHSRIMIGSCDVSNVESINSFFDEVEQRFGSVDILVNNAGMLSTADLEAATEEEWYRVMDTNLKSMVFTCQWFARHHDADGAQGAIVNIASTSSVTSVPQNLLYNISKAGVVTLTKTLARDLGPAGIRVNAVGPGSVPTDLNAAMYADPQREKDLCAKIPLGRRGAKDDIANAVLFLSSDESCYLTGQTIYAEGGWLLM